MSIATGSTVRLADDVKITAKLKRAEGRTGKVENVEDGLATVNFTEPGSIGRPLRRTLPAESLVAVEA